MEKIMKRDFQHKEEASVLIQYYSWLLPLL